LTSFHFVSLVTRVTSRANDEGHHHSSSTVRDELLLDGARTRRGDADEGNS